MRSVNDVRDERGAATVEFLGLTLVLLIPVVYLMIYVSQVQAAAFASVAAADQAVKAVVADADHPSAGAAHATVELTLADYGVGAGQYDLTVGCDQSGCGTLEPGEVVAVRVDVAVPVPLTPAAWSLTPVTVGSDARQTVPRF
ncbi:hypothetical protein [Micrococcus luteus]|uniref:hypothetical protein n=1 Tax=Micrococcus luteus TaxID=1270 RepID=UPI002004CAD4|nr:hypothetical protein [Micrococcus luteus]MCK6057081.1 hypothetical protein [Micrococcus luteus]MCK6061981.1 hypothetical protein [Micrococcus luteus]MCK6064084.1 hypothetical protein [Micrococcus luteus]MCK6192363.1 hypothetical protein [Micrococcus luteus]MCK6194443.1 hypothetical protein [Micrococcus luteus]